MRGVGARKGPRTGTAEDECVGVEGVMLPQVTGVWVQQSPQGAWVQIQLEYECVGAGGGKKGTGAEMRLEDCWVWGEGRVRKGLKYRYG